MLPQHITTMSRYNSEFPFSVAFPPQGMTNVLAEWLATKGVKQAHIAGGYLRVFFPRVLFSLLLPNPRANAEKQLTHPRTQKPRNTRTSRSSSTAASRRSSTTRSGT
jgi:bisphosphoglycerate-independent phosphoglycerate mutase (AlkP superfamily)